MPELPFRLHMLQQRLDDSYQQWTSLSETPITRLAALSDSPPASLLRHLELLTEKTLPEEWDQRVLPADVHLDSFDLKLAAPERDVAWTEPVVFTIAYAWWQFESRTKIAFIPSLGIHAIAVGNATLEHEVRREVRSHLLRTGATKRLSNVVFPARYGELKLTTISQTIDYPTVKARELDSKSKEEKFATVKKVATQLTQRSNLKAFQIDHQSAKLADALAGRSPTSVLLIGPSGCGKTATFENMIAKQSHLPVRGFRFWQTDGSRLIAGMSAFGQWQQRCQDIVEDLAKENAIIHFDNLVELIEVGRGGGMSQGIADFFRPFLVRGKIIAVAECTPDQVAIVERHSPQLLEAFFQLKITQPDRETTANILLDVAEQELAHRHIGITPAAVATVNRLHQRYACYSARPGRAIRFFQNLIRDLHEVNVRNFRTPSSATTEIDDETVTEAFSQQTGLPMFLLSDQQPLDLEKARSWFQSRVMGQPEAVDLTMDVMASVKAKLNRPERPIASLLFIGPTGVGKTEMAKSLAEFMYQDATRMVRFDMSEFNHPLAVERLIGGFNSPDGLLTSKVRENPFTVLLFDEFEKAHPSVFDLLLQVLGEGRLTDGRGQLTDFSTTIIIMTSNLGVDSFRETNLGFGTDRTDAYREHFINQVQAYVRPEFFNRIDRIVPFAPLEQETVRLIAQRELQNFQKRDGILHRQVSLRIDEQVADLLTVNGYDIRYGARPLKRAINREIAAPVATALNQYSRQVNVEPSLRCVDGKVLGVANQTGSAELPAESIQDIDALGVERRRTQALALAPSSNKLRNELYRHERALERKLLRLKKHKRDQARFKDPTIIKLEQLIAHHSGILERIDELRQYAEDTELKILEELYDRRELPTFDIQSIRDRVDAMLLELFLGETNSNDNVSLALFSRHEKHLRTMLAGYQKVCTDNDFKMKVWELQRMPKEEPDLGTMDLKLTPPATEEIPKPPAVALAVRKNKVDDLFEENSKAVGALLSFQGIGCYQQFAGERGIHIFKVPGRENVLAETTGEPPAKFLVNPEWVALKPFVQHQVRRTYDQGREIVSDNASSNSLLGHPEDWPQVIAQFISAAFKRRLNQLIECWN